MPDGNLKDVCCCATLLDTELLCPMTVTMTAYSKQALSQHVRFQISLPLLYKQQRTVYTNDE